MILSRTLQVLSTLSVFFHAVALVSLQFIIWAVDARGQGLEKALITHSSESISIAPLTYGIEKGFYRREGVDLQFRILRGDLALSSLMSGKEVDYIYGAGTAFLAAVRGAPVKILSHDFKSVLFYLMAQPTVRSPKDLKGKKIAVSSLGGTGAASARACLKALDLDPDKDNFYRHWRRVGAHGCHGVWFGGSGDHAGAVEQQDETKRF